MKAHENCKFWVARSIIGIFHATLVSCLVLPALPALFAAPEGVVFGWSENVDTCGQSMFPEVDVEGRRVALAGLAFAAFIATDLIISGLHGMATLDHMVHHVAFLAAGLVMRGHCILPLNAAILLAMEVSTPFLNFMLLFRNRGAGFTLVVQAAGIAFVLLFVAFRLVLNTYGAVFLWQHRAVAMPAAVPDWQRWFLLAAVAAGSALQFFWFPAIAKIFCRGLAQLLADHTSPAATERGAPPAEHTALCTDEPPSPLAVSSGGVSPTMSVSSKASTTDVVGDADRNSHDGGAMPASEGLMHAPCKRQFCQVACRAESVLPRRRYGCRTQD